MLQFEPQGGGYFAEGYHIAPTDTGAWALRFRHALMDHYPNQLTAAIAANDDHRKRLGRGMKDPSQFLVRAVKDAAAGLRCPQCGSDQSDVKDSRPGYIITLGAICRRRTCFKCQHRFNTFEIPVDDFEVMAEKMREAVRDQILQVLG